ncbi:MAG TPA: hypothetical protein VMT34_10595, partial [Aggregatilineales bacterium]|nr:hypothetical protein [Aggregatilineales bacterium]
MATVTRTLEDTRTRPSFHIRWGMVGFKTFLIYVGLCLLSMFFLFPLVWMVGTSLKTLNEITQPQLNL